MRVTLGTMPEYNLLSIRLLLAELDEQLVTTSTGITETYLSELYHDRLVAGFRGGQVTGAYARGHIAATVADAYRNLSAAQAGPHVFFNILDRDTDWSIRSRRGGLWQSSNLDATWLYQHVSDLYPDGGHDTYIQRWGLLQNLLGEHIIWLLGPLKRAGNKPLSLMESLPRPNLLALDIWDFCLWYANPVNKAGSFISRG